MKKSTIITTCLLITFGASIATSAWQEDGLWRTGMLIVSAVMATSAFVLAWKGLKSND